jgi:hypothetical protein
VPCIQGAEPPTDCADRGRRPVPWTRRTCALGTMAGWEPSTAGLRFLVYQCFRLPVVSSLWTPDGERPVGRPSPGGDGGGPTGPPGGGPGRPSDVDEEELAEQMAAMRAELANSPVEVVVANHCYGLFELAAVYLSQQPAMLTQARLAIDALGSLVDGLEGRLGDAEQQLKDGLSQLRLAYVQIDGAQRAGAEVASTAGVNGESTGGTGSAGDGPAPATPPADAGTGNDAPG